jgi:putative transposase
MRGSLLPAFREEELEDQPCRPLRPLRDLRVHRVVKELHVHVRFLRADSEELPHAPADGHEPPVVGVRLPVGRNDRRRRRVPPLLEVVVHDRLQQKLVQVGPIAVARERPDVVDEPPVIRKNFITPLDTIFPTCENRSRRSPVPQKDTWAMIRSPHLFRHLAQFLYILLTLLGDLGCFLSLCLRPPAALAAENLFLRKQLALYQERGVKPTRATDATRMTLTWLAHWFDWRRALVIVQPQTLIRWPRQGVRLLWRWKSRPGRPPIPPELQALIERMARDNPTWGEERIANELLLKLGLRLSPRTVGKYLPHRLDYSRRRGVPSRRWRTFVRNHAQAIVACDFCVVVTATFGFLYVFVVMEHATRRILHADVTAHPTATWMLQQLREAISAEHPYRFLIHNRDAIFSRELDEHIRRLGLRVLKTPGRSPQANALCERLLGTLRREYLDCLIPLTENHLHRLLRAWVCHYNVGCPHTGLGPGIPQLPPQSPVSLQAHRRHRLPPHLHVVAHPILGCLHHEYRLGAKTA